MAEVNVSRLKEKIDLSQVGHNQEGNYFRRRTRWNSFQRRFARWYEPVNLGAPQSSRYENDEAMEINDTSVVSRVRYSPYAIPSSYHRYRCPTRDQIHGNMEGEKNLPESESKRNKQYETLKRCFKVTIPFGIKYDKMLLLKLIQSECSVPFTPVKFHYEKMQAQFFVEDDSIASALKALNGEILDKDDEKIHIFVSPSIIPSSVWKELTSENMVPMQMKSEGELYNMKGLEPGERRADSNLDLTALPEKSTNISSLLELFPKLLRLDGQEVPPPVSSDTDDHKKLLVFKGNVFGSEMLRKAILQFLHQYYSIYDYGDRQCLLDVYHEDACFSLTIPFDPKDPAPSNLEEYFKINKNMKTLQDPFLPLQLIKYTKRDIVDCFSMLPKTQHDLNSFVVDVSAQKENLLCFSVNGMFKEVKELSPSPYRAFTRTFITVPTKNSSLCIVNDQMFVRNVGSKDTRCACSTPVATAASCLMPALPEEQRKKV
ncbi:nuclear RNA export factor 3-like [Rhynchocyon petersi]